jgi:hypothetical protein
VPDTVHNGPRRSGRTWLALAIIGVLVAVVSLLLTWVGSALGCVGENVACAENGVYDRYQGRVFDYRGRPAANVRLTLSSPVDDNRSHEAASTDGRGRFCIRAVAPDYGIDSIGIAGERYAQDLVVRSNAPVDPRLADPTKRAALRTSSSNYTGPNYEPFVLTPPPTGNPSYYAQGAISISDLWNPRADATQDCTTVASHASWWRTHDARSTWQFAVLIAAPLAVIAMFLLGANQNRILRRSGLGAGASAYRPCVIAAVLNVLLFLGLWGLL